jgi:hypothetical protein
MNRSYIMARSIAWSGICLLGVFAVENIYGKIAFGVMCPLFIWQGYSWWKKYESIQRNSKSVGIGNT